MDGIHEEFPGGAGGCRRRVGGGDDGSGDGDGPSAGVGEGGEIGEEGDGSDFDFEFGDKAGGADNLSDFTNPRNRQSLSMHITKPIILSCLLFITTNGTSRHEKRTGSKQLRIGVNQFPRPANGGREGGFVRRVERFDLRKEGTDGGGIGGGAVLTAVGPGCGEEEGGFEGGDGGGVVCCNIVVIGRSCRDGVTIWFREESCCSEWLPFRLLWCNKSIGWCGEA